MGSRRPVGKLNALPAGIEWVKRPLIVEEWAEWLCPCPEKEYTTYRRGWGIVSGWASSMASPPALEPGPTWSQLCLTLQWWMSAWPRRWHWEVLGPLDTEAYPSVQVSYFGEIPTESIYCTSKPFTCRFRHPNLITLTRFCEEPCSLVYPLMERFSFFHSLHEYYFSATSANIWLTHFLPFLGTISEATSYLVWKNEYLKRIGLWIGLSPLIMSPIPASWRQDVGYVLITLCGSLYNTCMTMCTSTGTASCWIATFTLIWQISALWHPCPCKWAPHAWWQQLETLLWLGLGATWPLLYWDTTFKPWRKLKVLT